MIKMYLTKLFPKVEIIDEIDFAGIADISLDLNLGALSQLKFNINTSNSKWEQLKNDFNLGICVSSGDTNLVFAKSRDPQIGSKSGKYDFTFFDFTFLMSYSERKKAYKPYKGSAFEYIRDIYDKIVFELVSDDRTVVIEGGRSDNFAILEELCKKAGGWTWRQGSAVRSGNFLQPIVEIGTFSDKPVMYEVDINPQSFISDQNKKKVLLTKVVENYAGITPSYVFAYGNAGEGASNNTIVTFKKTNYPFVNYNYPLIEINNQIYIQNVTSTPLEIFEDKEVQFSSNGYFEDKAITDIDDARKTVYQEGVSYLKSKQDIINYSFDIVMRDLALPGVKIKIAYFEDQQTLFGKKIIYDINTEYFMKQITYKKEDLLNF